MGLLPLITKATRKYHNSATLIDQIFAIKTNNQICVGVLEDSDLSGHFGTWYIENMQIAKNKETSLHSRKITKNATQAFINQANSVNWDYFGRDDNDQMYYQNVLNKIEVFGK